MGRQALLLPRSVRSTMSTSERPVRVGVLSLHSSKETKAICNAIEALGHQPEWLREENVSMRIENGDVTVTPEVDVIANRLLLSNTEQPCEELGLARMFTEIMPVLNPPGAAMTALHKFASAATLATRGIPVPDAFMALDTAVLNDSRPEFGSFAVYKTAIGTHGGGTWSVGEDDIVNAMVGNRRAFLQDMIMIDDERNHDLRAYVVGDRLVGAMNRYAPDHDWRTNVALGGSVEDATDSLSDEVRTIALEATDAIGLDYAGVDLVKGTEGWHVLEVNPTAGFRGLFRATGRSPAPYIAQLAIERGGGAVDPDRVAELADVLDDSEPACKPRPRESYVQSAPKTVGLTEEVLLSGTSGTESVISKSDTGASRTSIDTALAAAIGAGPIKNITRVKSGSSKSSKTRPVVDVVVGIGGNRHTVTASVEDRSHMDYPVLLGRDILKHYHVDVTRSAEASSGDEAGTTEE